MSTLLLIRHAQASFLADDYDNLSPHGLKQSTVLGEYLADKGYQFDALYAGTLKRQLQTCEQVQTVFQNRGLTIPEVKIVPELNEYEAMGSMEDYERQLSKYHPQFKEWFAEMKAKPSHKTKMKMVVTYLNLWATGTLGFELPSGVQTFQDFRQTAEAGLRKVMLGNEKGKTIAAFSSGGCIAAMLGKIIGVPDPGKVMGFNLVMLNTAISEILFSGSRLSMKTFNGLPHLQDEMVTTM